MAPFPLQVRGGPRTGVPQPEGAIGAIRPDDRGDVWDWPVHRGFVCYIRSQHKILPIEYTDADFAEGEAVLREILEVIQTGRFPEATRWKSPLPATAATEISASSSRIDPNR